MEINDKLRDEWDFEKNKKLEYKVRDKVWWICKLNPDHKWQATLSNRKNGSGCPYCAGKVVTSKNSLAQHSKICLELHPEKSKDIIAENIAQYSSKKVWWKCSKGHEWVASIASRTIGSKCPVCSGKKPTDTNNLAIMFPDIASEWHVTKNNFKPEDFLPFSKKKVWWMCQFGHEWQASICDRTLSGSGCHVCSGYSLQHKCEESLDGISKRCNNCNEMKRKTEFRKRTNSKGHWINSICKDCEAKDVLIYRTMTKEGIVAEILRHKRHYCKKYNVPFDLTKEYLFNRLERINWKCELTGRPMRAMKSSLSEKYQGFNLDSISVDRINHKGGYTQNNIRFVINQVNIFRSSGSDDRMYEIAEALLKYKKSGESNE